MFKSLFCALLLCVSALEAVAANLVSQEAASGLAKEVVTLISAGKVSEGIKLVKPHWLIPSAELDVLSGQIQNQRGMLLGRFGNPIGVDKLYEKRVGDTLYQVVYIEKFEKHMLQWKFVFYKPGKFWILNKMLYNDDIDEMVLFGG